MNPVVCPKYYFDPSKSQTIDCTGRQKYIKYGSGATVGEICSDYLQVHNTGDMKARMYFIESVIKFDYGFPPFFGGILGLSPKDESAGPLFIDYLYD